jgi:superfamily II DNA or RNA helicase
MKTSRFPFFFSRLCSSLFLLAFLLAISATPEKTRGRAQSSGKLTDLPKEITLEFNKGEKLAPKFLVGDVATPITTGLSLTDDLLEVVLSDQAWVLKNNTGFKYRASELRKEIKLKYTHTETI